MLTADEVKQDLNSICAQTNAHWLCYDDIHTIDKDKDVATYLKEMERLGYSKKMLFLMGSIELSHGGGLEINHQEESFLSGYTLNGRNKNKTRLVILSGFQTDNDRHTVYHEGAHLLQFKYNIFNMRYRDDYTTYLSEVHANTFAAMVLLLKAKNVLEYKKCRLARLADGGYKFFDARPKMLYYISLPIELQLLKEIRKKGRLNMFNQFSKNGNLDFKKILFHTKSLVEKYAYSEQEFKQLKSQKEHFKHLALGQMAKAYRILGQTYWQSEALKSRRRMVKHADIEYERAKLKVDKVRRLSQKTPKAEIINEICKLDCFNVEMTSRYGIFSSLADIQDGALAPQCSARMEDQATQVENIIQTYENMRQIYEHYKNNEMFSSLYEKLKTFEGRNEIWALKAKERQKEANNKTKKWFKKQNSR